MTIGLCLSKGDVRGPGVNLRRARIEVAEDHVTVWPRPRTGDPFTITGAVVEQKANTWTVADDAGTWEIKSCGCGGSKSVGTCPPQ